jgi:hypothetical protein
MAAGQFPGLEDEGREDDSSQVVGQLQENGLSLVHVVLPSVRLHHNGQRIALTLPLHFMRPGMEMGRPTLSGRTQHEDLHVEAEFPSRVLCVRSIHELALLPDVLSIAEGANVLQRVV